MKVINRLFLICCTLFSSSVILSAVPVNQVEVVNTFPHDPEAFTQGLVWHEGQLYEGTGRNGQSSIRRVTLESGEIVQKQALGARYFGEGITILNDKIYQLTWRSHLGFIYDLGSFRQLQTFFLPGEGWGITHDGTHLIVSDGTAQLRFIDPATMKEVRRIEVTQDGKALAQLNELEYINGEIWANVWYSDHIVRIDPQSGSVNSSLDLGQLAKSRNREDVLNGIAWDEENGRIFVTGKLWPELYEISIRE